jgi:uncharacterized protein YciI
MLFLMICEDQPDSLDLRMATRSAHLAFIGTLRDQVRLAGPILTDDGERMIGSVFLIEAADLDDVRALNARDPYTRAGLFASVVIRPFRQVFPAS